MKILEMPKDFNIRLIYGKTEIFIGEKIKFNTPRINLNEYHISDIYMKKIGFTPYKTNEGLVTKKVKVHYSGADIVDVIKHDSSSISSHSTIQEVSDLYEILTPSEILENVNIILESIITLNSGKEATKITKYNIRINEADEVFVKETDHFWFSFFEETGLEFGKNDSIIDINELKDFFSCVANKDIDFLNKLQEYIFNGFSGEYGFFDIYQEYKNVLTGYSQNTINFETLQYYFYLGKKKFYFLCEHLIKNDMKAKIYELNPVKSGKEIPEIKDLFVLSKVSMEIVKRYRSDSVFIDLFGVAEKNPKIGINGIKMIDEYTSTLNSISHWDTSFSFFRIDDAIKSITQILDIFDITLKVLIDKCVRATFYENYEARDFLRTILDYASMSELLGLKVDKKIPQDIIKRHDLLASQIKYIKDKKVEDLFILNVSENNKLLSYLPKNDNYILISPKTPKELVEEGLNMNHCVGSYVNRYSDGSSKIFFLRDATYPDSPYVTVELNQKNSLVQAKGRSNSTVNKDAMKFIESWVDNIKKN